MSRDKQIEEMAKEICNATQKTNQSCNSICFPRGMCAHCKVMAEHLYNASYRKASDLAEEIFAEIDKLLTRIITDDEDGTQFIGVDMQKYYALKKKYTEVAKRREVSENNTVRCFHPSVTESQREAERREDIEKSPVDCSTPSVTESQREAE